MRMIFVGSLMIGAALLSGPGAASAAPIGGTGVRQAADSRAVVTQVQSWSRYCDSLRRACLYKDRLGEQGQGNCRTYREQCRGYSGGGGRYRAGGYEEYGEPRWHRYRGWEY